MHKANWDDLRYLLAVAEHGSVSAAARALRVNHATVLRRIAAFEQIHGGQIFDRTPQGYAVPGHRRAVIDAMRTVEEAVLAVERLVEGARVPLAGPVRVTSTDTFCVAVLPPILASLAREAHDLRLDLISSNAHLDLARMDAEITVRPARSLPEGLTGTSPAALGFAAYAAPGTAPRWLGMAGPLVNSVAAGWLADETGGEAPAGSGDSFLTLREMAAAGQGRTVLPCILGDADPRLERLAGAMPPLSVEIWVASHPDLAAVPRIRAVSEHLCRGLAECAGRLAGAR